MHVMSYNRTIVCGHSNDDSTAQILMLPITNTSTTARGVTLHACDVMYVLRAHTPGLCTSPQAAWGCGDPP